MADAKPPDPHKNDPGPHSSKRTNSIERTTHVKLTRQEIIETMTDSTAITFRNTNNSDRHYLHSIFKHKAFYYDDEGKTKNNQRLRIYFFDNEQITDQIYNLIDRSKLSNTADYFRGSIILLNKNTTTDEGEEDPDQGQFQTPRRRKQIRKRQTQTDKETKTETTTSKTGTIPKSNLSSDLPATANQNAGISKSTNDNTGATTDSNAAQARENSLKIRNHTIKPGNPFHISQISGQYNLKMPRRQYYSHKFQTTTLEYENKSQVMKFVETVPKQLFGDRASYELYCPARSSPVPRAVTQDWNAVIRGVEPDIDTADFEKALTEHDIQFRRTSRIMTATGQKTHMIRIYFDKKEDANEAILNGISILGRRYRVEPPEWKRDTFPAGNVASMAT